MMGSVLTRLRRLTFLLLTLLAFASSPVAASEQRITPEMISEALEGQGYSIASVTRTLLGRVRVVASRGLIWREVVLDLSSGQILRDYAVEFSPEDAPPADSVAMPRGGQVLSDHGPPDAGG